MELDITALTPNYYDYSSYGAASLPVSAETDEILSSYAAVATLADVNIGRLIDIIA